MDRAEPAGGQDARGVREASAHQRAALRRMRRMEQGSITLGPELGGMAASHVVTVDTTVGYFADPPASGRTRTLVSLACTGPPAPPSLLSSWGLGAGSAQENSPCRLLSSARVVGNDLPLFDTVVVVATKHGLPRWRDEASPTPLSLVSLAVPGSGVDFVRRALGGLPAEVPDIVCCLPGVLREMEATAREMAEGWWTNGSGQSVSPGGARTPYGPLGCLARRLVVDDALAAFEASPVLRATDFPAFFTWFVTPDPAALASLRGRGGVAQAASSFCASHVPGMRHVPGWQLLSVSSPRTLLEAFLRSSMSAVAGSLTPHRRYKVSEESRGQFLGGGDTLHPAQLGQLGFRVTAVGPVSL